MGLLKYGLLEVHGLTPKNVEQHQHIKLSFDASYTL